MAEPLQISSNALKLLKEFQDLPAEMQEGIVRETQGVLLEVEDLVRTGTKIKSRRGSAGLMGRLTSFVRSSGKVGFNGAIGFRKTRGFPYELAQEFGAVAKAGGAMAIPLSPQAKRLSRKGISAKDFPGILIKPGKKSRVLIEYSSKKRRRTELHYVLVKRIGKRLRFLEIVTKNMDKISDAIEKGAKSA